MNEIKKPTERIYSANEYENKDKNNEFQTSNSQTSNNFKKEEELKNVDVFNGDYNNSNIVEMLDLIKYYTFSNDEKINFIKSYIETYIEPKIKDLFKFFKDKLNNQNSTNKKFSISDYSFKFLIENMDSQLKVINTFFDIFDFIKLNLDNIDYNLFIELFIISLKKIEYKPENNPEKSSKNNLEDKYNIVIIWKFINNIYMMKIYYNITTNIKSKNFSILCENNNLCKEMLINIIHNPFFVGEYFFGLFDYIYFEDRFILKETEDEENRMNESNIYKKFEKFHDNLYFLNENNYFYLYKSIKAKNIAE